MRFEFERTGIVTRAVVVVTPAVAAALFYVWAQVTTVRLGYALSEASDTHRVLIEENRGLRIEVAALRAPERLERLAAERYQLEPPRTEQVIRLPAPTAKVDHERLAQLQPIVK